MIVLLFLKDYYLLFYFSLSLSLSLSLSRVGHWADQPGFYQFPESGLYKAGMGFEFQNLVLHKLVHQ
jgi:hypothetical protein